MKMEHNLDKIKASAPPNYFEISWFFSVLTGKFWDSIFK